MLPVACCRASLRFRAGLVHSTGRKLLSPAPCPRPPVAPPLPACPMRLAEADVAARRRAGGAWTARTWTRSCRRHWVPPFHRPPSSAPRTTRHCGPRGRAEIGLLCVLRRIPRIAARRAGCQSVIKPGGSSFMFPMSGGTAFQISVRFNVAAIRRYSRSRLWVNFRFRPNLTFGVLADRHRHGASLYRRTMQPHKRKNAAAVRDVLLFLSVSDGVTARFR